MICFAKLRLLYIFFNGLELQGYQEVVNILVAKPGRRLYNIRNLLLDRSESIIVQIDATEGNKVITVRSPLQVKRYNQINQKPKSSALLRVTLLFFLNAIF